MSAVRRVSARSESSRSSLRIHSVPTVAHVPSTMAKEFSDEDLDDTPQPCRQVVLSQIKSRLTNTSRSQSPKKKVSSPSYDLIPPIKSRAGVFAPTPMSDTHHAPAPPPSTTATPRISDGIRSRQRELEQRHHAGKSKDDRAAGGGVALWPLMSDMRLNQRDAVVLVLLNIMLLPTAIGVFFFLHDGIVEDLSRFTEQLKQFNDHHGIPVGGSDQRFRQSLVSWHTNFDNLTSMIERKYETPFGELDLPQKAIILSYLLGLLVLVYYLFENVMSPSRLTPERIKQWITLLNIVVVWTFYLLKLLLLAISLENAVQETVLQLSGQLPLQIASSHDVAPLTALVQHWHLRVLPPTGRGALSLWGSVRVPEIVHYLQYYSWPFIAAIVTPIFKLVLSLKTVYGVTSA